MSGNPMGLSPEAEAAFEQAARQARETQQDDQGRIDWEMTIDRIDGKRGDDGAEWDFGELGYDDPVFEKIKRGVRKMRREG